MPPFTNIATGIRIYCENPNTCGSPVTATPPPPPSSNPLPFITWTPWLGPFGGPANYGGICPCGSFVSVSELAAAAWQSSACWCCAGQVTTWCFLLPACPSTVISTSLALHNLPCPCPAALPAAAVEHLVGPVIRFIKGGEWRADRHHCAVLRPRPVPTGGKQSQHSTAQHSHAAVCCQTTATTM